MWFILLVVLLLIFWSLISAKFSSFSDMTVFFKKPSTLLSVVTITAQEKVFALFQHADMLV